MVLEDRPSGRVRLFALAFAVSVWLPGAASAETLENALANAYAANPTLNAARAQLRATDEAIPQALSGWRPQVSGSASAGTVTTETSPGGSTSRNPTTMSLEVNQPLFRGFRTVNATKQAEAQVQAGRAGLSNTVQNVLLDAVEAYMNVVRDEAIVRLRRQNVEVLGEQLRATQDRFTVGELTRTDTAQAEARLSAARSELNAALAALLTSRAIYRQVIGLEPNGLQGARPITRLLPGTLDEALARGRGRHPAILAARYSEEAASFAIKVAEGALLPSLSLQGSVQHATEPSGAINNSTSAQVLGVLSVPIYQGGGEYSSVRQAKQTRAQRALEIDVARDQVDAAILSAWGGLQAADALIVSARAQIDAASIALAGVREEARVGQRTTLDVLNAEQELLNARVTLVSAERDRVVASYALLAATGGLSPDPLGLAVAEYRPEVNTERVRDRWFGLRTPDGQ